MIENSVRKQQLIAANSSHSVVGGGFINFGEVLIPASIVIFIAWGELGEVILPACIVIIGAWGFIVSGISVGVIAFTITAVCVITVVIAFAFAIFTVV